MRKQKKYYVVWEGKNPGIYETWDECKKQIEGYKGAKYKSFKTLDQAKEAFCNPHLANSKPLDYPLYGICVDASYSTKTKEMEYRGILLHEKNKLLFSQGGYKNATNNIGEFIAIVHALALCKKNNWNYPIYSDSKTAISWVNKKKVNTKLKLNEENHILFEHLTRALNWLKENTYNNKIIKWNTEKWGEIPADYNRK
ncbi:MAG: ribonuclease H family protein [Bacteroidales bacterium]|nr:ribonuclease H family protein [Bacteroidales bacterium]